MVPETALRRPGDEYASYHTGRGGEGNVHRDGQHKPSIVEELKDKVKGAVGHGHGHTDGEKS